MTIKIRPGEYRESIITHRPGEPGNPITITGPPDAIVRPPADNIRSGGLSIVHSHIHLTGLSLDGLGKPDKANDPKSYARSQVRARPPTWQDSHPDYLTDVKIKPHRIGNSRKKLIGVFRVNNLEIGEFEVIGPAGVAYLPEAGEYGLGEIVSIGRSSNNFATINYPWPGPDRSHGIHVHHIANLNAHHHTELIKLHAGHYDVTVEYCTDNGGFGRSPGSGASIDVRSAQTTIRWCKVANGRGHGILIENLGNPDKESVLDSFETITEERYPGRNNAVYGNRITNVEGKPVVVSKPGSQHVICGNQVSDGDATGDADKSCPENLPKSDTIGHLGGDSPWA